MHLQGLAAENWKLVLEMALLQGLVAENAGVVLEMTLLQGLVAEKQRPVLEKAPLQGLAAENWKLVLEMALLQGLVAENPQSSPTMSVNSEIDSEARIAPFNGALIAGFTDSGYLARSFRVMKSKRQGS